MEVITKKIKISDQDILLYPWISIYILVYIHARYPYSYLPKLPTVYPVICFYPNLISRNYIPIYIQLRYPDYIQIYPLVSIIDIYIRYPWSGLVLSHLVILKYPFILLLNPETISMMVSNYDIPTKSKYIHVYPI
jgi:hypothetical protein